MKWLIAFLIAIQAIILCTSCGSLSFGPRNIGDSFIYTDKFVKSLLYDTDIQTIENMFSKASKESNDNLRSEIISLKEFLVRKNAKWESNGGSVDKSATYGKVKEEMLHGYFVEIDNIEYYLRVAACTRDTENSNNVGIYSVYFNIRQDEDATSEEWYKEKPFGIYSPLF